MSLLPVLLVTNITYKIGIFLVRPLWCIGRDIFVEEFDFPRNFTLLQDVNLAVKDLRE